MRYQLLQIREGIETILLDTDSKKEIRKHYDRDDMLRIRVYGQTLLIFQAEDWLNNLPIREYKEAAAPKRHVIDCGHSKPVMLITDDGAEIQRFKSLTKAAAAGFGSRWDIRNSCEAGKPTLKGYMFRWAE